VKDRKDICTGSRQQIMPQPAVQFLQRSRDAACVLDNRPRVMKVIMYVIICGERAV